MLMSKFKHLQGDYAIIVGNFLLSVPTHGRNPIVRVGYIHTFTVHELLKGCYRFKRRK